MDVLESFHLFTFFYILVSFAFVYRTTEFVSLGLTIENLFSPWLKYESDHFIYYHIKRSVTTIMTHASLPFGYFLLLILLFEKETFQDHLVFQILVALSLLLPATCLFYVIKWYRSNWRFHPIAQNLKLFCDGNTNINTISTDINNEFRRTNTLTIPCGSLSKIIVTDNWLIKITSYNLNIFHQSDINLQVVSTNKYNISPSETGQMEYLNIKVTTTRPGVQPITIRLDSFYFKDLQDRISRPIAIMQNVVFHPTLTHRFLSTFHDQVSLNPVIPVSEDLDICIGCMQKPSNVKLQKNCELELNTQGDRCTNCYCKPMWCMECMGKWFASRQNQDRPESWLSSKCTCPMCRSVFCILDVCSIIPEHATT